MIKKLFCYMILFLFFIFSFSLNCEAESHGGLNLIYQIRELTIGGSTMNFDGFAFIDHMDNYGGKNLKTYIIAKVGGSEIYRKEVSTSDYYDTGDHRYFYIRCQGTGCSQKPNMNKNRRSDSCNRSDGNSDCAYYNVNFKTKVDLNAIISAYGDRTGDIELWIECVVDSTNGFVSRSNPLGVHKKNCKSDFCKAGASKTIGNSTIKLLDLSEKVKVTATSANMRDWVSGEDSGRNFDAGTFYNVKDYDTKEIYVPHLERKIISDCFGVISGGVYAVYDSWAQMPHGIKISFGDPPPPPPDFTCDSGYDEPAGDEKREISCGQTATYKECEDESVNFEVKYNLSDAQLAEQVDPSGSGKICGEEDGKIDVSVSTTILIHQDGIFNLGGIGSHVYAGRGFEFPNVDYTNKIYFRYGISDGKIVYKATAKYGKWEKVSDGGCSGYRKGPNGESRWDYDNDGYFDCESYSPPEYACDPVGNSYELKLSDTVAGDDGCSILKDCMSEASSKAVYRSIDTKKGHDKITSFYPNSYDSNVYNSSDDPDKPISGVWNGSGYSGKFVMVSEIKSEQKVVNYNFNILDAYVKLNGEDFSYVKYSSSDLGKFYKKAVIKEGEHKKYFVPLRFPESEKFIIDFPGFVDVSFVNNLNWLFDADCFIKVKNNVFDGDEPKFFYRPIDIYTPFPEGNSNAPVNWRGWINVTKNRIRLENSYNKINYGVKIKHGDTSGNILGINVISKNNENYNSWVSMNPDGDSRYLSKSGIKNKFITKNISYCPIGSFRDSCNS